MNFGLFYRQMLPNSHSKITLSLGGEGGKQKDIFYDKEGSLDYL